MASEKRVIALRLDDELFAEVQRLAGVELRSVANMADILLRRGLRDVEAQTARAETVARIKVKKTGRSG